MRQQTRTTLLAATVAAAALAMGSPAADAQSSYSGSGYSGSGMSGTTIGTSTGMPGRPGMMDRAPVSGMSDADAMAYSDWSSRIAPNWEHYRAQLRRQFPQLSEAELFATNGDRSQVLSLVQERYRLSNERADSRLTEWQRRAGSTASHRGW